jgi:hypothetical protein
MKILKSWIGKRSDTGLKVETKKAYWHWDIFILSFLATFFFLTTVIFYMESRVPYWNDPVPTIGIPRSDDLPKVKGKEIKNRVEGDETPLPDIDTEIKIDEHGPL